MCVCVCGGGGGEGTAVEGGGGCRRGLGGYALVSSGRSLKGVQVHPVHIANLPFNPSNTVRGTCIPTVRGPFMPESKQVRPLGYHVVPCAVVAPGCD